MASLVNRTNRRGGLRFYAKYIDLDGGQKMRALNARNMDEALEMKRAIEANLAAGKIGMRSLSETAEELMYTPRDHQGHFRVGRSWATIDADGEERLRPQSVLCPCGCEQVFELNHIRWCSRRSAHSYWEMVITDQMPVRLFQARNAVRRVNRSINDQTERVAKRSE